MKIFADREIKLYFAAIFIFIILLGAAAQLVVWKEFGEISPKLALLFLALLCGVMLAAFLYVYRRNKKIENAVSCIEKYLAGNTQTRIECDSEGELYRLFYSINTLASVLSVHAENELDAKVFLKNTISDISHQLKTPLAALNIYNGLILDEAGEMSRINEFARLSEGELDRIDTLVQNLLKIAQLDAGTLVFHKNDENVADMMYDTKQHFEYRTRSEEKEIVLSGSDDISLKCDRQWIMEAMGNIVKNALDHTNKGDAITIEWTRFGTIVQIKVRDNGSGIHPENLNHIFKRFYRSGFSSDTKGIGLGLPIAKAIIEAHNGTIEADSEWGRETVFTVNFKIPTKL